MAGVHGEVDEGGNDHAAERGDGRQRGGPTVAQLAGHQLALDLEAGEEEEQGHQPVVDEAVDVHVQLHDVAEVQDERGAEKRLVASLPGRVGPQERHAGGGQHDEAAGRLDSTEAQRWAHERARHEAIRVPPAPAHQQLRRRGVVGSAAYGGALPGVRAQLARHASTVTLDGTAAPEGAPAPAPLEEPASSG